MASAALIAALHARLDDARRLEHEGRPLAAFVLLEEAHVLSQRLTRWHVRVHWRMWRNGFARRDWREVLGQSTRLPAALIFSRLWVPAGNTGGARVGALRPMPIPEPLQALLDR
jgi:hypothetical protein